MKKNLPVYEVMISEETPDSGVNAISLVDSPAIKSNFIALSEDVKIELKTVDDEKRILMGAVLIPNSPIYRNMGEEEFYIIFSKDTIRRASELFFIKGNQSETTEDHRINLKGNTVVESWIKEDMEKDKSAMHGLNDPVGSWIVSMKIEDEETYKKAKGGELKGFSIEGFFNPVFREELHALKQEPLTDDQKIEEIKKILNEA